MTRFVRRHDAGGTASEAVYSACERYRYALTRTWDTEGRRLLWIMLNPSKATETANDPTIERCERRARRLGYGAFRVVNLFALRQTDPARLLRARAPVGRGNDAEIARALEWADDVLCGWGVHGAHRNRGADVRGAVAASGKPPLVLGLTKDGHPRHPLYVGYSVTPRPWSDCDPRRPQ